MAHVKVYKMWSLNHDISKTLFVNKLRDGNKIKNKTDFNTFIKYLEYTLSLQINRFVNSSLLKLNPVQIPDYYISGGKAIN